MDTNTTTSPIAERRAKPRIICNYPALIRGQDAQGDKYEQFARVINLSRSGAYVLLKQAIQEGDVLYVRIAFPTGSLVWGTPKLTTNVVVVRSESKNDGLFGIAVEFHSFRFI